MEFHGTWCVCRNDASLAAAELCIAVEDFVLQHGGADTVGTCGSWRVEPNAVNSVPRVVELHIDLRDIVLERRDTLLYMIQQHAHNVAERRKVQHTRFGLPVVTAHGSQFAGLRVHPVSAFRNCTRTSRFRTS